MWVLPGTELGMDGLESDALGSERADVWPRNGNVSSIGVWVRAV